MNCADISFCNPSYKTSICLASIAILTQICCTLIIEYPVEAACYGIPSDLGWMGVPIVILLLLLSCKTYPNQEPAPERDRPFIPFARFRPLEIVPRNMQELRILDISNSPAPWPQCARVIVEVFYEYFDISSMSNLAQCSKSHALQFRAKSLQWAQRIGFAGPLEGLQNHAAFLYYYKGFALWHGINNRYPDLESLIIYAALPLNFRSFIIPRILRQPNTPRRNLLEIFRDLQVNRVDEEWLFLFNYNEPTAIWIKHLLRRAGYDEEIIHFDQAKPQQIPGYAVAFIGPTMIFECFQRGYYELMAEYGRASGKVIENGAVYPFFYFLFKHREQLRFPMAFFESKIRQIDDTEWFKDCRERAEFEKNDDFLRLLKNRGEKPTFEGINTLEKAIIADDQPHALWHLNDRLSIPYLISCYKQAQEHHLDDVIQAINDQLIARYPAWPQVRERLS